jgi:hypothetical protein
MELVFLLVVYFLFGYWYAYGKQTDNLLEFMVILVFWPMFLGHALA